MSVVAGVSQLRTARSVWGQPGAGGMILCVWGCWDRERCLLSGPLSGAGPHPRGLASRMDLYLKNEQIVSQLPTWTDRETG